MSQRLFSVSKVGLFCDSIVHATEKRKGDDVKIVTLTLRVQPFDAKLATALDTGIGGDSNVRPTLFKLNHPDPKPLLRRADFALGCPRQQMHVFASPDTEEASILLDHVRIAGTYARTEKNVNGYGFVFKASFGPLGKVELSYIQDWHLTQRFVTFEEAEPSLEFEEAGDDDEVTDADEKAREVIDGRPKPIWDDEPVAEAAPDHRSVNRPLHSHQSRRKDPKKAKAAKQRAKKR